MILEKISLLEEEKITNSGFRNDLKFIYVFILLLMYLFTFVQKKKKKTKIYHQLYMQEYAENALRGKFGSLLEVSKPRYAHICMCKNAVHVPAVLLALQKLGRWLVEPT